MLPRGRSGAIAPPGGDVRQEFVIFQIDGKPLVREVIHLLDHGLAQVLSHPTRIEILKELTQSMLTPKEFARYREKPVNQFSYHFKMLLEAELIELVRMAPRRGGIEPVYRSKPLAFVGAFRLTELPPGVRGLYSASTMESIIAEGIAALKDGCFDYSEDTELSCICLQLDSKGRKEAAEVVAKALTKMLMAHERSAVRCSECRNEPRVKTTIFLGNFKSAAKVGLGKADESSG